MSKYLNTGYKAYAKELLSILTHSDKLNIIDQVIFEMSRDLESNRIEWGVGICYRLNKSVINKLCEKDYSLINNSNLCTYGHYGLPHIVILESFGLLKYKPETGWDGSFNLLKDFSFWFPFDREGNTARRDILCKVKDELIANHEKLNS